MTAPATQNRQPFAMDPESYYILDCSVELGELTPLEAKVFYTDTPAARNFYARGPRDIMPPDWLRNTARQFLNNLPIEARYVWALYGLRGMEFGLKTLQERVEFAVQVKVQKDLGIREGFSFLTELRSEEPAVLFPSVHDITPDKVQAFVNDNYADARLRLEQDLAFAVEAYQWLSAGNVEKARDIAIQQRLVEKCSDPLRDNPIVAPSIPLQRFIVDHKAVKQRNRQARGAIKKVLKLFDRTGSADNVRLMVQGKEVVLMHPDSPFKFVLKAYDGNWLVQKTVKTTGHVPYQLSLMTKDGVFLSRLCVLFEETPVLDQLLALTMYVRAGDEMEILQKANWFGVADANAARDYLTQQAPELLPKVVRREDIGNRADSILRAMENDQFFQQQEHWEPYQAPVRQWVAGWFGELLDNYAALGRTTLQALPAAL